MANKKPRLLLVMQTDDASAGRCGYKLQELNYALQFCYPLAGEPLPEEMDDYVGVVVFGGPMSANDDAKLPGVRSQLEWIPKVLNAERPFLGICLGAQLLARVLGATVKPHPAGLAEIGYFAIQPTGAGQVFFETPLHVYHWHREGFELPTGAELLAIGARFPHQAYRYGAKAFGLQFHPEVDQVILENWLIEGAEELTTPGAQSAIEQRACHTDHDARLDRWFDRFLEEWLRAET